MKVKAGHQKLLRWNRCHAHYCQVPMSPIRYIFVQCRGCTHRSTIWKLSQEQRLVNKYRATIDLVLAQGRFGTGIGGVILLGIPLVVIFNTAVVSMVTNARCACQPSF